MHRCEMRRGALAGLRYTVQNCLLKNAPTRQLQRCHSLYLRSALSHGTWTPPFPRTLACTLDTSGVHGRVVSLGHNVCVRVWNTSLHLPRLPLRWWQLLLKQTLSRSRGRSESVGSDYGDGVVVISPGLISGPFLAVRTKERRYNYLISVKLPSIIRIDLVLRSE